MLAGIMVKGGADKRSFRQQKRRNWQKLFTGISKQRKSKLDVDNVETNDVDVVVPPQSRTTASSVLLSQ